MTIENLIQILTDIMDEKGPDIDIIATDLSNPDLPAFEITNVVDEPHRDLDGNSYGVILELEAVSDGLRPYRDQDDYEDEDLDVEQE